MTKLARPLLALLVLLIVGCRDGGPSSGLRVVPMTIGNSKFNLEVADTPETQEKGLMKRDSMPSDHGMLFVFDKAAKRNFWMKNTRIPLDIIYLDETGKVVSIKQMKPYDQTGVSSDFPAKYAIELNAGAASKAGVKVGTVLNIPPEAANPP